MQFQYEVFFEEQPDSLRLFSEFISQFPADISGGYAETDDGPLLRVFQSKQVSRCLKVTCGLQGSL